jgi:hypothetical protein
MSYTLDTTITSTSTYTELRCPGTTRVNLQVSNGKVLIGFGEEAKDPGHYPSPDESFLPVVGAIARRCDRIRVKAATPISSPAPAVIITAVPG